SLEFLYAANVAGIPSNGVFYAVAWSSDGGTLYGSGDLYVKGKRIIRAWSQGGRGAYVDLPTSEDTVLDLLPLAKGRVAFGAAAPTWGVLGSSGRNTLSVRPVTADLRAALQGFRLSRDGLSVRFGFEVFGRSAVRFSLAARGYDGSADDPSMIPPRIEA